MDSSSLEADFGIARDDLWDVIEHMDKKFDIKWGEADYCYFFYPEGVGLIWDLFHRDQVKSTKAHPITVSHLVKVTEAGVWFKRESLS